MLFFFFSFRWGMNEKTDVHIVWRVARHTKMCTSVIFIHTSTKRKKSTVNSYNLISNHFYAKLKGNQLRNEAKFKFIRKRKNKPTNGHGGWLFSSELPSLKESEMSKYRHFKLLSWPFLCVFHIWFKRYRRRVVYNDVTRDSVTCSLTLHHVTENRYEKCPVHFFGWHIFHLLSYEQNRLTNRIAGKLMNIKKIKLFKGKMISYTASLQPGVIAMHFRLCLLGQ